MKKTSTLALALALASTMSADTVKLLTLGWGTPGIDEPALIGLGISGDGKYVCGTMEMGMGMFVTDLQTGQLSWTETSDDLEGSELRNVDRNGLAIGYDGPGVTYSIDGVRTEIPTPEGYKYVLGNDLTADGSTMVGTLVGAGFNCFAGVSINGAEWKQLPMVDSSLFPLGFSTEISSASYVSGDGKVIAGFLGSFSLATAWIRNDDGVYEADPFYTQLLPMSADDTDKPLIGLSTCAVSDNGRYILCYGVTNDDEQRRVPVVYNTRHKTCTVYDQYVDVDYMDMGLTPTAIANDGTFIGSIGVPIQFSLGSFVWKAGEDAPVLFSEAYPTWGEQFFFSDMYGFNVPTDISADGRYVIGYAFYTEDFMDPDPDAPAYYVTYVIDCGEANAVEAPAAVAGEKMVFSIDGTKRNALGKGLNIVRNADGSVTKVFGK